MSNAATALYKALHKKRAYTKLYWDIANAIGIYEALLIEIVERWCELNEERGKLNYFQQDEWWTSATYQEWAEMYPKMGTWKSIQKMFLALEKQGYVLSGKFTKGSQVKYYRVNPESIGGLLLSGTLKFETGIVSKSDGTVSKSDGTVSKSDDQYIEDQIIQKDHSNTPHIPSNEDEEPSIKTQALIEEEEPSNTLPTSEGNQQSLPQASNFHDETEYSAAPRENDSQSQNNNRISKTRRSPRGDRNFGAIAQERYQKSLAARVHQNKPTVLELGEMKGLWQTQEELQQFESFLLDKAKQGGWAKDPIQFVAIRISKIANGEFSDLEFREWKQEQTKPKVEPIAYHPAPEPTAPQPPLTKPQPEWSEEQHDAFRQQLLAKRAGTL
jgi:hypothetical protein